MRALAAAVVCCLLLICSPGGPTHACTSFCMNTPDGPIYGTNLDLFIPGDGLVLVNRRGIAKESWRTGTTGERVRWTSEYGSVTFSLVGREYAWGGMNEAGLVMSSMELRAGEYPGPDERPPLYDGRWCQYMLDTCSGVDEVVASSSAIRVQDQSYTSQYLVADEGGNCAVFEYIAGELVYYTGKDLPLRALANGGPRWWWSNPGQSAERVAACHRRNESFDARSDSSAVNYAFGTLVYYVAAPHTKWNIVFNIAERELWFRSVQSPTYKHISLDAFDLSCDAPKLMLGLRALRPRCQRGRLPHVL